MALFKTGEFMSSSEIKLPWKIECESFDDDDWQTLAGIVATGLRFSEVEGVPRGGLKFAEALQYYRTATGGLLIVDDVLTTGANMERHRNGRDATGVVVFDRSDNVCPRWIIPIWRMFPWFKR